MDGTALILSMLGAFLAVGALFGLAVAYVLDIDILDATGAVVSDWEGEGAAGETGEGT